MTTEECDPTAIITGTWVLIADQLRSEIGALLHAVDDPKLDWEATGTIVKKHGETALKIINR
jgi:hypothetical protein